MKGLDKKKNWIIHIRTDCLSSKDELKDAKSFMYIKTDRPHSNFQGSRRDVPRTLPLRTFSLLRRFWVCQCPQPRTGWGRLSLTTHTSLHGTTTPSGVSHDNWPEMRKKCVTVAPVFLGSGTLVSVITHLFSSYPPPALLAPFTPQCSVLQSLITFSFALSSIFFQPSTSFSSILPSFFLFSLFSQSCVFVVFAFSSGWGWSCVVNWMLE